MNFKSALLSVAVAATLAGCASPMLQAEKQASVDQANKSSPKVAVNSL